MFDVGQVHGPEQAHRIDGDQAKGKGKEVEVDGLDWDPQHQVSLHDKKDIIKHKLLANYLVKGKKEEQSDCT